MSKHIFFVMFITSFVYGHENMVFKTELEYRELAHKLHILDNITYSIPTFFVNVHYSQAWDIYFGANQEDEKHFEQYRAIRRKYYALDLKNKMQDSSGCLHC